jgi:DNA-directed RNA polymerase subunit RPC12/RpoP
VQKCAVRTNIIHSSSNSGVVVYCSTLRVLLEHGFEPNERLEAITEDFDGARDLIEYTGYAPLQILASAAFASLSLPDSVGAALKCSIVQMITGAAELLVRCGGRLSLEPPPASRLTRSVSSISNNAASTGREPVSNVLVDRESLKIDSNNTLIRLLGGEERLNEARDHWSQIKSVKATRHLTIHREVSKSNLDDSEAPGGSDEKSCAICWTKFGTLRNRKHKCRVTLRYVCEDCSRKRVIDGKEDHRVSDGQFCLARVDAAREAADAVAQEKEQARMRLEKARAVRLAAVSDEENRDSLFSGVMEKATSLVFGEEERAENTSNHVDSLASSMNQTKDALLERGNKLTSLGEKTSQLVDSSHEFAKMAKELERQQKGGLFW